MCTRIEHATLMDERTMGLAFARGGILQLPLSVCGWLAGIAPFVGAMTITLSR